MVHKEFACCAFKAPHLFLLYLGAVYYKSEELSKSAAKTCGTARPCLISKRQTALGRFPELAARRPF